MDISTFTQHFDFNDFIGSSSSLGFANLLIFDIYYLFFNCQFFYQPVFRFAIRTLRAYITFLLVIKCYGNALFAINDDELTQQIALVTFLHKIVFPIPLLFSLHLMEKSNEEMLRSN